MNVAVLGGTGLLGGNVAGELRRRGVEHRLIGRSSGRPDAIQADLVSGQGLAEAIEPADTVIHLATSFGNPVDVDIGGTDKLLGLIADRHLIYMSIVGVDRHPLPYYMAKHEAERRIARSAARYSILRATQFHDYIAFVVARSIKGVVCIVPGGYVYQPVDVAEVAAQLVDIAIGEPSGLFPDLAGPEVIGLVTLARTYMSAVGRERPVLQVPRPGKLARAYRHGVHTNPQRAVGHRTWAQYLEERFGEQ